LRTIRDALIKRPAEGNDRTAGAIERVAEITLSELKAASPAAIEWAVQP
jgi:hypothetical protein